MKFRDLLNEKYHKTVEVKGNSVEVFINPNKKEINNIIKNSKSDSVRFSFTIDNKMYAWDGEIIHRYIETKININGYVTFYYEPKDQPTIIFSDYIYADLWKDIKNKKQLIKYINLNLPKVKTFQTLDSKEKLK